MSVKGLALGETKACFSFDRQGNKKKGADGPPSRARGPNQWAPLDLTWAYVYVLTPDSLKISANLTSSRSGYKRCGILFFRSECSLAYCMQYAPSSSFGAFTTNKSHSPCCPIYISGSIRGYFVVAKCSFVVDVSPECRTKRKHRPANVCSLLSGS